jgi:hypothetical protein
MVSVRNEARSFDVEEVEELFYLICEGYHRDYVDIGSIKEMLETMCFFDEHGVIWTLGINTGNWYLWDGSSWMKGTPEGKLYQAYINEQNEQEEDIDEDNPIMKQLLKKT